MDWRDRAACLNADPELFFPLTNEGPSRAQVAEALTVCQGCTERDACLDWALDNDVSYGVWGGTSEDERRFLQRRWPSRRALTATS